MKVESVVNETQADVDCRLRTTRRDKRCKANADGLQLAVEALPS